MNGKNDASLENAYLVAKIIVVVAFTGFLLVSAITVVSLGRSTISFYNKTLANENRIGTQAVGQVNTTLVTLLKNISTHLIVNISGVSAHAYYNSTSNGIYSHTVKNYSAYINKVDFNTGFKNGK